MNSIPQTMIGNGASRNGFEGDLEAASFVPVLLSIAKSTRALFELKLAKIGLHVGQDQLLAHLGNRGDLSIRDLANLLGVRPSTVSKMADRMQTAGLVERRGNYSDGRVTKLRITPAGELLHERIETVWQAVTEEMKRSLANGFGAVIREMRVLDGCLSARLSRLR